MKKMIFVTNSFPFGIRESSFIRPEIKELQKYFDITVVARNTGDELTTDLSKDTRVLRYDAKKNYNFINLLFRTFCSVNIYREIKELFISKRLTLGNLKKAVRYYMRALHFAEFLRGIRQKEDESVLLYSYWNDYSVMSLSMIKREGDKLVSRIHRADLYLNPANGFYLPMKKLSNEKTDLLAFIADEGKRYFEEYFPCDCEKQVFRLGVKARKNSDKKQSDTFNIYSFSYLVPVKRVELIAKALAQIDNINISWTHIGSGECEKTVKTVAEQLLDKKQNISYSFVGAMENERAMEFLSENDFQLLVNVSYSEGVPVTMMEAMSLSIPVIATDVGGVGEIVSDGYNGFLVPNDAVEERLRDAIIKFYNLSSSEKTEMQNNAYQTWNESYRAEKNEKEFADRLLNL